MNIYFDELKFQSNSEFEMIPITGMVKECVKKSGVKNGAVTVFSQHTTGSVRVSESEESLLADYRAFFSKLVPKGAEYGHNRTNVDDRQNAHSHLQSMVLNSSETVPIKDGKLMLGTWQTIFFVELDGARAERKVILQVIGE